MRENHEAPGRNEKLMKKLETGDNGLAHGCRDRDRGTKVAKENENGLRRTKKRTRKPKTFEGNEENQRELEAEENTTQI
jgi:hypothetical protein